MTVSDHPDFGNPEGKAGDLEALARMGVPMYRIVGSAFYASGFSTDVGYNDWVNLVGTAALVGAAAYGVISQEKCLKLTCLASGDKNASIDKYLPPILQDGKVGIAATISAEPNIDSVMLALHIVNEFQLFEWELIIDWANKELLCSTIDGGTLEKISYKIADINACLDIRNNIIQPINLKMVIDVDKAIYGGFWLNNYGWSVDDIQPMVYTSYTHNRASVRLETFDDTGGQDSAYVDNVLVTTNEVLQDVFPEVEFPIVPPSFTGHPLVSGDDGYIQVLGTTFNNDANFISLGRITDYISHAWVRVPNVTIPQ